MSTWIIIGLIILAIILLMRRIMGNGNVSFWKVASQNPDAAFDWFMREDCWIVVSPDESDPGPDYTGPFRLAVPKLGGKVIKVYGREGRINDSQQRFIEHYRTHSTV